MGLRQSHQPESSCVDHAYSHHQFVSLEIMLSHDMVSGYSSIAHTYGLDIWQGP